MEKTDITSRAGNFTSSQIWKLMTNDRSGKGIGARGLTYIAEKKMEARLGRQLEKETVARSATWGTFVQHRVTNTLLDMGCKPTKDIRRTHPIIKNWTGSEDYLRSDAVGEVKCFELKNFCITHDAARAGYEILKKACPETFWQLISNAILNNMSKAELCLYVPYKKELNEIREEAKMSADETVKWLAFNVNDDQLPYLMEGKYYKNLTTFSFDIDPADIEALTARIKMANKIMRG